MAKVYLNINELPIHGKITDCDTRWITIMTLNKTVLSIPSTSIVYISWDKDEIPFDEET